MYKIILANEGKERTLASFECNSWADFREKANECWCNLCETLPSSKATLFVYANLPYCITKCHFHVMDEISYCDLYGNKHDLGLAEA